MANTKTSTRTVTKQGKAKAKPAKVITATGNMANAMKHWQAKLAGAKPAAEVIAAAGALLKRNGTAKHLALAMYMRPTGATQTETVAGTGDTQINAYYDAVRGGQLEAVTLPARNGHKVYALALPKAKVSKPKRAAKAKPAKAEAPATEVTS
jgi:hypothetical protein